MGRYVSIRHNGSLTVLPTAWLILGILVPVGALMAGLWLHSPTPQVQARIATVIDTLETLLWIGTASICVFTAAMLHAGQGERARAVFLAAAGLATFWLCLDGAFQFSRNVMPAFLAVALHVAVAAVYLAASWRFVLTARTSLFALAVVLFAAGANADLLTTGDDELRLFAEQGLTFLALAFWACFHIVAAATALEELAAGRITTVHVSRGPLLRRTA